MWGSTILFAPQKERVKALSEARLDRSYVAGVWEGNTHGTVISICVVFPLPFFSNWSFVPDGKLSM